MIDFEEKVAVFIFMMLIWTISCILVASYLDWKWFHYNCMLWSSQAWRGVIGWIVLCLFLICRKY